MQTKEVYDLLVDKSGFLWVANELGVSRYDGLSFLAFNNSSQTSLGATGLMQDEQGRIWCSNFTGQIFYIQNEKMELLNKYNYKQEATFPRIALFHNKLVATSDHGLFVLDTKTFHGEYLKCSNSINSLTTSLSVFNDRVLAYGNGIWYLYKQDGSFKKIPFDKGIADVAGNVSTLHANTYADTAYLMSNPAGVVKKLGIKNDTLKLYGKVQYNSFVNTISLVHNNQWVNTTTVSYNLKTGKKMVGYNLSDMVIDFEGNRWFSSLNRGLLVSYNKATINKTEIPNINKDDLVISIKSYGNNLLLGTQNGKLLLYDPKLKTIIKNITFPGNIGSISNIAPTGVDEIIIGTSVKTYNVNMENGAISEIPYIKTLKQIDVATDFLYVASAKGMFIVPRNNEEKLMKIAESQFKGSIQYDTVRKSFFLTKRCRAICYYPQTQSLYVAFKDGIYVINKSGIKQFVYANNAVYAASLCRVGDQLFIGTINNGLLALDKSGVRHVSIKEGLLSKTIFKIKAVGDKLWIIGSGSLQLLDTKSLKILNKYDLPSRDEAQVIDIEEIGNDAYLATLSGLFSLHLQKAAVLLKPRTYLLSVKAGNVELPVDKYTSVSYAKNNFQFKIGVPSFSYAKDVYIKYCLVTGKEASWQTSEPGERLISFSSLMPGKYTFEAMAVDPKRGVSDRAITYSFFILPPWWQSLWFKVVFFILVFILVLYILISYTINKLTLKKAFYAQQQSIKQERQRISSEIHDDIGSGLFAIQLFADLASKKTGEREEISQISEMLSEMADKIREVIWSTNIENDNLENLLYYVQFHTTRLFEHSGINFRSSLPDDIVELNINSQSRRNIFLIIRELAHNAIKHSKAGNVDLTVTINDGLLVFILKDDGTGFDSSAIKTNGMGLENIQLRVASLKGNFKIENYKGTIAIVKIPVQKMLNVTFDYTKSIWRIFTFDLSKYKDAK